MFYKIYKNKEVLPLLSQSLYSNIRNQTKLLQVAVIKQRRNQLKKSRIHNNNKLLKNPLRKVMNVLAGISSQKLRLNYKQLLQFHSNNKKLQIMLQSLLSKEKSNSKHSNSWGSIMTKIERRWKSKWKKGKKKWKGKGNKMLLGLERHLLR